MESPSLSFFWFDMLQTDFHDNINKLSSDSPEFLEKALLLLSEIYPEALTSKKTLLALLQRLIVEIDHQLSKQISEILHHPDFGALESSWRSVESLLTLPVNYQKVTVRILDLNWQELSADLNNSLTLRRSTLYNLVGNRELNTSGGRPFGMVVIDHDVSMSMGFDDAFDDIYTLELISGLGELCLCPFILSPATDFFGEAGADWITDIERIDKILDGPEFSSWRHLQSLSSARFLGMAMPRIRLRERYANKAYGFMFNETEEDCRGFWGSAAYLLASVAIREFNRINWFGFMKSRWQDQYYGAVVNVPNNARANLSVTHPEPDIRLFGELAGFYSEHGFVPLCHSPLTDKYYLRGNNSVWADKKNDGDQVMGQLQTTLMICRIAHYLKVQIRGMIGNFQTAEECERFLSHWLDKYSSNLVNADESTLAKYPLSKGQVTVREVPGSQGRYVCDVLVQPQYQFDHICGEVLLSTDLGYQGDS